jgi:hypothetical protein
VLGDEREHLVDARHRVGGAGHERGADLQRDVAGGRLVAERGDRGGDGPIQVAPASSTACANSAFSDRKP